MLTPALHPEETRRLRALRRLNLLETPIEERFERITRAARQMLDMPIAAITLVDEARQWCKSVQGLETCEMQRKDSFCAHALLGTGAFVVADARKDSRFADNPMVTDDPWMRFYAGQPLRVDGVPVGTLCVADRKGRRFGAKQETILRSLAQTVEAEFRSRETSEAQRGLLSELDADKRRSAIDTLTRLWNRETILEILQREFHHARRKETGIGAIFIGLDAPERIAEHLGIVSGDAVLRKTARRLLRALRPQDAVGRFGGQQFLGVVTRTGRAELAAMAQHMRAKVAKAPVRGLHGTVEVTVSVGAAWAPATKLRTSGELLDAADAALCWAQVRGGNRVEVRAAV